LGGGGASKEEIRTTDVNYPVISPYSSQCHDPPHLQALASDNSLSRLVLSKKHTQNYINYNYQNKKKIIIIIKGNKAPEAKDRNVGK
jgi:hypothetical protein